VTDVHLHVLHVPGADPERDEIVARLRGTEGVSACVHEDPHRRGVMQNWLSAIVCAVKNDPADQPWAYVLSDDADPAMPPDSDPIWVDEMTAAAQYSPAPILGMTHFGKIGRDIYAKEAAYGVGRDVTWGGAIAYRRDILPDMVRWCLRVAQETGYPHDDRLVGAYAYRSGFKAAMCGRAIFGQPVKRSLLGHNTPIREPSSTIAEPPISDWSEGTVMNVSRSLDKKARELAERYSDA